jgi:hypothetical protein
LPPGPLTERLGADEFAELTDELGVTAGSEVGVDPCLDRLEPCFPQARYDVAVESLACEVRKRFAPPQIESSTERLGGLVGSIFLEKPAAFVPQALEPRQVDVLGSSREEIPGLTSTQHVVGLERLPQAGDVLLEGRGSILRRVVAPQLLDEAIARDDSARLEHEHREDASLLDTAEAKLAPTLPDLAGAVEAEGEASRQTITEPRRPSAGCQRAVSRLRGLQSTLEGESASNEGRET